jgi:hypothetical protein
MSFRCPELDGLADQLMETYIRKASALTIEQTGVIERELEYLLADIYTHRLFCKICSPMEQPNNSVHVRQLAKSEMENNGLLARG